MAVENEMIATTNWWSKIVGTLLVMAVAWCGATIIELRTKVALLEQGYNSQSKSLDEATKELKSMNSGVQELLADLRNRQNNRR